MAIDDRFANPHSENVTTASVRGESWPAISPKCRNATNSFRISFSPNSDPASCASSQGTLNSHISGANT